MTHLYDRQSPRDLTIPELWASWDIMIDQPSREAKLVQGTLGRNTLPSFALNDENTPSECKIFSNIMAAVLEMAKANDHKYSKEKQIKLLDIGYRSGMAILGICFAMDAGSLQTTLRRIAQIKSKIDVLDTNKTCQAPRKEFRKLHDNLIKYCKDRDPDGKLFLFDYKAPSTKSDCETMMMMAMMKFMDM